MSQWTHVNASIRFDGIEGMTPKPNLGYMHHFDEGPLSWSKCNVPCGSEGSLEYMIKTGEPKSMARYVATIWGDLRDYSDVEEIKRYLTGITRKHMIRSGIAEIYVESDRTIFLRFNRAAPNTELDLGEWEVVHETTDNQ